MPATKAVPKKAVVVPPMPDNSERFSMRGGKETFRHTDGWFTLEEIFQDSRKAPNGSFSGTIFQDCCAVAIQELLVESTQLKTYLAGFTRHNSLRYYNSMERFKKVNKQLKAWLAFWEKHNGQHN